MKKLIITLMAISFLILGSASISMALTTVTATLTITGDNILFLNVNSVPIPLGPNYNDLHVADEFSITLNRSQTNYISFYVANNGLNSPDNPTGFLAQITLDTPGPFFAETGTNQILSGDEAYWMIGANMFDSKIPTAYADNAGGGNPGINSGGIRTGERQFRELLVMLSGSGQITILCRVGMMLPIYRLL